jgi:hypothetical protein
MNDKVLYELLDRHNDLVRQQNNIMRQILDNMPRPTSKFNSILETAVLIGGVLGLVSVVDTIRKWIIGG